MKRHQSIGAVFAAAFALMSAPANAEDIVVTNFGVSANGMPYAVALEKGFFKDEGIKVDNVITSAGGGTTLRNMLAANVAFAEINPAATSAAILQGVELQIIAETVYTVAEFAWIVKKDSPVKTIADLKGKKLGFINPRGTSVAINNILLEKGGLKNNEVEHVRTGGFGEGLTALDLGAIDATPITEPLWSKFADKYRVLAKAADIMPPMNNVVAVTLAERRQAEGRLQQGRAPRPPQGARLHDQQSGRGRRHDRQALQPRAGGRPREPEEPAGAEDRGRALLVAWPDPPRRPEGDDRGADRGRRHQRPDRHREAYRHQLPAGRSESHRSLSSDPAGHRS